MEASFTRYLVRLGAALVGVFAVVWLYVVLAPMAYMEGGYPAWVAKMRMLDACRLGDLAFFGDSRLESGVIPALLPVPASNLGVAAGTPVEVQAAVRRALACERPPSQAVISLTPEHFGPLTRYFWLLSVRYGFISPGELYAVEQRASALGDTVSLAAATPDGFGGRLRDWLYAIRFPSLSFSSLVQGRVFGRYQINMARLDTVLGAHGWSEYGAGGGLAGETREAFAPTKLQNAEFEATLDRLHERGVDVVLLVLPFAHSDPRDKASQAAYLAYLAEAAKRHPGVRLAAPTIPYWPDRLFGDGEHLTAEGAKLLTERLAACTQAGRLQPPCDLEWHGATAESSR
jgi:hypothetical protein